MLGSPKENFEARYKSGCPLEATNSGAVRNTGRAADKERNNLAKIYFNKYHPRCSKLSSTFASTLKIGVLAINNSPVSGFFHVATTAPEASPNSAIADPKWAVKTPGLPIAPISPITCH